MIGGLGSFDFLDGRIVVQVSAADDWLTEGGLDGGVIDGVGESGRIIVVLGGSLSVIGSRGVGGVDGNGGSVTKLRVD